MPRCFCELMIVLPCKGNRVPLAAHTCISPIARIRKNQLVIKRINFAAMQGNALGTQVLAICCNYKIVICGLKYCNGAER